MALIIPTPDTAAPRTDRTIPRLEALAALHGSGDISDAELAKLKQQILAAPDP